MKKIFIISIICLFQLSAISAKEQFIYQQISRNEGFTSTVNCIFKEKDGDVWLGTPNGLYRYNGYTLRHYQDSLLGNRRINKITEDKHGNMWVLTDHWLLYRKKGSRKFKSICIDSIKEKQPFHSICEDENGLWLGSSGRLFRYTFKDESFSVFKELKGDSFFIFRHLGILDQGKLLCGSHSGMLMVDINSGEVSDIKVSPFREVSSSMTDSKGNIWVGFYNHGIEVYDKHGNRIKCYNTGNSHLSNDIVLCMTERDSSIWAGTDGGGINIIDPETDNISVLSHIAGDPSSFPAHSIKSIYTDRHGNIWAGSVRDGLIRVSISEMKTYSDSHIGTNVGLSNPTVLCIYEDTGSGNIWVGTDGEGLNSFNPDTYEFTHHMSTLKTKVVSIARYSDSELALSVYSDNIWIFNQKTGKRKILKVNDDDFNYRMKYGGRSINLANEKDGSILFLSNMIMRFDKETGKCSRIQTGKVHDTGNFLTIGSSQDGIWLHDNKGIYFLKNGADTLEEKGLLRHSNIRSGCLSDGLIWLATEEGLYRFDVSQNEFTHISTSLFSDATSVICDMNSRVWIGTEQNLYAYLIDSGCFTLFGDSDGASQNEFLSKPKLLSSKGDVYMGGVQGLLCIGKDYSIESDEEPVLGLYNITADGMTVDIGKNGIYEIPRHSKTLKVSVSTQEKDMFRSKMYRYRLSKGGPLYEKHSPVLEIQQMPEPGKHDLIISCTKRNGNWTDPVKIATIRIKHPWYLSGWFIGSIALLILTIIGSILISMANRKANRLQLALKEQEQIMYEEKVKLLINISHELRTPLTLIMAPLKRLIGNRKEKDDEFNTLNRIYRQSRRMKDLLNMVLDLRKMEVGKAGLKREKVDFNRWIKDSVNDIAAEELSEGISIVDELDERVSTADIDRQKCEIVLMNILINAVKHSSSGDTITIRTLLTDEGMVRVSISDQGPGLTYTDPSKMFTRFYQSNNEQYGSGIGLSYSKILVEMHGGKIGAENNPDKGATFWWEIPGSGEPEMQTQTKAYLNELLGYDSVDSTEVTANNDVDTSRKTLLIVDDSSDLLDFLRESLTGDFSEVLTATSGNKALRLIATCDRLPDVIVSDVNMPDGDGYSLCKGIKNNEKYSHIPLVLLTARDEEQSQSESYRSGADAFMAKPFEIETLMELLRSLLKRKEDIRKKYLEIDTKPIGDYGSNEEAFIISLNRIIAEHISDPDLDQRLICHELGVSRALLYNRMKSITGSGTKEYITRIRLEKAKSLIESTNLPIIEISEMTGFASQSYFSTAFKTYTGMTPSQYKKTVKTK